MTKARKNVPAEDGPKPIDIDAPRADPAPPALAPWQQKFADDCEVFTPGDPVRTSWGVGRVKSVNPHWLGGGVTVTHDMGDPQFAPHNVEAITEAEFEAGKPAAIQLPPVEKLKAPTKPILPKTPRASRPIKPRAAK